MLFIMAIVIVLGLGLYIASLFNSPAIAHAFFSKPIHVRSLSAPQEGYNRLVIPKLGIDIPYSEDAASLVRHAQWRHADRGNPVDGGSMILTAHRLSVQPTPQQTIEHSPFYTLANLSKGDKLILDYNGVRYGYEVATVKSGAISSTPLTTSGTVPSLVLYTFDTDDDATRTVVTAHPLGKVAL